MAGAERKSDLGVRATSAVVMLAIAGTAFWLGGWGWALFVGLVAAGVLWEWIRLARGIARSPLAFTAWQVAGMIYIGFAAAMLLFLRSDFFEPKVLLLIIGAVVATDVGAYFAGRAIGGPKIAPSISPSKTWAGLAGGASAAALVLLLGNSDGLPLENALGGVFIAVTAQAGDFFESWMKRRAGVKDSGTLLPGHGGLFDRVDGLLAVMFAGGVLAGSAGALGLV